MRARSLQPQRQTIAFTVCTPCVYRILSQGFLGEPSHSSCNPWASIWTLCVAHQVYVDAFHTAVLDNKTSARAHAHAAFQAAPRLRLPLPALPVVSGPTPRTPRTPRSWLPPPLVRTNLTC